MTHILVRQKKEEKNPVINNDYKWKNKQLLPIYDMSSHSDKAHMHT